MLQGENSFLYRTFKGYTKYKNKKEKQTFQMKKIIN